ncbi:MAG: hypothetical protein JW751_29070 [Polyangiaceae bacterium]|nr:hypothetical protein [Polyangiaceae bacterium]
MPPKLSTYLTAPVRRWLRVRRRVPDTTLRDALLRIEPDHTRRALRSLVRGAQRRKAFESEDLAIGVVSVDGKQINIRSSDDCTPSGRRRAKRTT